MVNYFFFFFFFFKQKTAYELRISDWSSDVCSSDLIATAGVQVGRPIIGGAGTIELPAIIEGDPQGTQVISAAIAGRVVALTRNLGQSVGRGQTIAVIESREAAQIKG